MQKNETGQRKIGKNRRGQGRSWKKEELQHLKMQPVWQNKI
ncbi:hypothetical protein BACCAP_02255 [Pseudoflavonifractor capillosus ATCC 29799]|uniref:Uncharacterized protein n=1 Tax=Pseudoflavonifractor capillosus ATCC 29799 TaxID=411467 RepID=A6NVL3_9FIRM|nr:hypothetical protein BACCAP_02255 [Pseudoflavonifractor capillosus ATCC 29799]